ncbi:MAG: DUF1688 family protein [Bdellovibrionaceae bacterium]|nr:DUF1688 family protein [Pseudobdellovibrionaceae bacterium]
MSNDLEYLLSPRAVRDGAEKIFDQVKNGEGHFRYHPEKLAGVVKLVLEVTRANYPDLKIPFHSRWGHFRVGGVKRLEQLNARMAGADPLEVARTRFDLAITSVLLDAGAGMTWSYQEGAQRFSKSEGLAVASFHLFMEGGLAGDGQSPRADGAGLSAFDEKRLQLAFQVTPQNPLVGATGRVALMRALGEAVLDPRYFKTPRPGALVDLLIERHGKRIPASGVLRAVLDGLGPIWPGRLQHEGRNLGDIWHHSRWGLIAFHKLSQWMTYSLIEPLIDAGLEVYGVEELTGLAEYRNGGLILDSGLVSLKDPAAAAQTWTPDSDLIIEWRALTVALLDVIGARLREELKLSPTEFPLAKALEGGTWWAGRRLAKEQRADGGPPLSLQSDGTVF